MLGVVRSRPHATRPAGLRPAGGRGWWLGTAAAVLAVAAVVGLVVVPGGASAGPAGADP